LRLSFLSTGGYFYGTCSFISQSHAPGGNVIGRIFEPHEADQRKLADAIHVPYQRVNDIVNGRRGITPSTALRLAKFFGMSPDFWMNLQLRWDLYFATKDETRILEEIHPFVPRPG